MSESSPPVLEERPVTNRFAKFAALLSVLTPLIAICSYVLLFAYLRSHGHVQLSIIIGIVSLLVVMMIVVGLVLGIIALAMTRSTGCKDVFGKAIVGVSLNGIVLALFVVVTVILPLTLVRRHPVTPQGRLDDATKILATATNNVTRFYALGEAAKESFNTGRIQDARNYANELLKLAPDFRGDWNYGNAIQDGNLVLGRIAVHDGQIQEAAKYLLQAGSSPGSPQMDSFGPNMSLAKDLLEKGDRETVLHYFELCRKFWSMDYGKLNQWSQEVKSGEIPDFGANLVY
jgi:hypothetical protein